MTSEMGLWQEPFVDALLHIEFHCGLLDLISLLDESKDQFCVLAHLSGVLNLAVEKDVEVAAGIDP